MLWLFLPDLAPVQRPVGLLLACLLLYQDEVEGVWPGLLGLQPHLVVTNVWSTEIILEQDFLVFDSVLARRTVLSVRRRPHGIAAVRVEDQKARTAPPAPGTLPGAQDLLRLVDDNLSMGNLSSLSSVFIKP